MKTRHSARIVALSLLAIVGCAQALDSQRLITQYGHTAWRVRDGDLPAPAYQITQTADGYLWIGTQAGLVRYDGARFVPLTALSNTQLPIPFVLGLVAAGDGSLWIGTSKGLSHWVKQRLVNYPDRSNGVGPMLEDRSGNLWFASLNPTPDLSLCVVGSAAFRCYGKSDGIDFTDDQFQIGGLTQDRDGTFWLSTTNSVLRWTPGSKSVRFEADTKTKTEKLGWMILAADPNGALWVGIDARGKGLGLQQLAGGVLRAPVMPQLDPSTLAVQALFVDHTNTLWVGTQDQGIIRIRGDKVDRFRATDGLSGDGVYWFYEDREGNLWVSTSEGIDRFRDLPVASFSSREGLSVTEADSVLASKDGRIWIGGDETLDILDHGRVVSFKTGQGLPGHQVTRLLEDRTGKIWIGLDHTLTIYRDGKFTPIHGLNGGPLGFVDGLVEDTDGNVWARVENKLVRIRGDQVREEIPLAGRGKLAADREAGVWALQRDRGSLLRYRNGEFKEAPYNLKHDSVSGLSVTSDGTVLVHTDGGIVAWKSGQQRTLTRANGMPCNDTYGSITDRQNALWIFAQCGWIQIPAEQLRQWWERPDAQIHPRLLDVFDGVAAGHAPFNLATRDPDGRLWFANSGGLVEMLDPEELLVRHPSLPVHIEEVVSDRKAYVVQGPVRLAPNPHSVEIDYTALSLAVPQRVHFLYKLDGHDRSWQQPGNRRQAFYTDLAPGNYLFHVIASDSHGAWNTDGATLGLTVTPAWYQTLWFRSVCVLLGIAAIALLYRLRVRQIARGLRARFDERLAERTRLARELHDTLMQTIQGSKMVADDALEASTDLAGMRRAMERLSTWLTQATQEGRAALNALRASTTQHNDLAEGLRSATEECAGSMDVVVSIDGMAREMHPIVRDEIYRIGYEAIRNACQHSKATRLEVALSYARDLTLVVSDDGQGMDSAAVTLGKQGHYGIQGMRERAHRIGSILTIASGERSGTEVRLVVPGRVIFRKRRSRPASFSERLGGLFGR